MAKIRGQCSVLLLAAVSAYMGLLDIRLCLCVSVATSHCDRPGQTGVPPSSQGPTAGHKRQWTGAACMSSTNFAPSSRTISGQKKVK